MEMQVIDNTVCQQMTSSSLWTISMRAKEGQHFQSSLTAEQMQMRATYRHAG
jgi:hypothetical protein